LAGGAAQLHWKQAMQTFQILFGEDRVPVNA
jgi:hypothetical protein